jgi:hypothetical protein
MDDFLFVSVEGALTAKARTPGRGTALDVDWWGRLAAASSCPGLGVAWGRRSLALGLALWA